MQMTGSSNKTTSKVYKQREREPKMSDRQTSDVARSKAARLLKRHGSASSLMSGSEYGGRYKHTGSVSTVSFMDEPQDPNKQGSSVKLEPTYQMEPAKRFPVNTVKDILGEVLQHYLAEEKYEPELCKQMTKTISDVVKARVKDLQLGRYKIIAIVHIGELRDQGLKISSRCLWDAAHDNSSSYEYRNNSLFATAMVYGVYHE